jgi:hypothetical protein
MKRIVLVVLLALLPYSIGIAETVTWTGVTQYTDNTAIPAAKQSQLSYDIQYRIPPGSFTAFGTATGGATSFAAPYVTPGGGTSYWRVQTISVADNNSRSAWSPEHPFVRAFQAPAAPPFLSVQ